MCFFVFFFFIHPLLLFCSPVTSSRSPSLFSVSQENRPGYHTHQSGLGSRSHRFEAIESHGAEARLDTVDGGSHGGGGVDEVSPGFAMGMGFPPRQHHSGRLASRRRALPLQVTCQRLRSCQGKPRISRSFVRILEYLFIVRDLVCAPPPPFSVCLSVGLSPFLSFSLPRFRRMSKPANFDICTHETAR